MYKKWLLCTSSIALALAAVPEHARAQNLDQVLQRLERVESEVRRLEGVERENALLKQRINRLETRKGNVSAADTPATVQRTNTARSNNDPAAAQAAYIPPPAKAPGVAYVRVCSLEGDGFFYIPGTDACIKIGGYLRLQGASNASGDGIVKGASTMTTQGLSDRVRTNDINYQARAVVSLDVRAPTPFGQLRGYLRSGVETITPAGSSNSPSVFWDRGFIQFAGFTAGKTQSFFDLFTLSNRYTYANLRTSGDTELNGAVLVGYTHHFGGGLSAGISVEDPGAHWKVGVVDASASSFNIGTITTDNGLSMQSSTTNGFRIPDIIANLRVDQAWGFLGVSGAIHSVAGAYYGTGNAVINGTPDDKLGWAVAFGGRLNIPGTMGDTFGVNVVFTEGAVGYALRGEKWSILRPGESIGLGWGVDGVFDTGTPIHLTQSWGVNGAYEHFWTPLLRSSVYGGYARVDYNREATQIINAHLPGAAGTVVCGVPVAGAVWPPITLPVGGGGNSCNPDFGFAQIGTRTQYNPFAWLDVGVDVNYTRLFTAYRGPATVNPSAPQPAVSNIDDQNVWTVMGRVQLNFLP